MSDASPIAIEVAAGQGIKLTKIASRFQVNISTAFRWIQKGLPRVGGGRAKLEAVRAGKSWISSEAAIIRWLEQLPQSDTEVNRVKIRTPAKREAAASRAKKALADSYGI